MSRAVLMVLKHVCNMDNPYSAAVCESDCMTFPCASCATSILNASSAGLGSPKIEAVIHPMSLRNQGKVMSAHTTPNTLKTVCAKAARLAEVLPTAAAILAVIVVPMFSPNTIAHAMSK